MLDDQLTPQVFLVGILCESRDNSYPACVDPEDEFWIGSEAFNMVLADATHFLLHQPEPQVMISHELARRRRDDALFRTTIRDSMLGVINKHPEKDPGVKYFASVPERVGHYLVSAVIGLHARALASHYNLGRDKLILDEYRETRVVPSLIDAVIDQIFYIVSNELKKPEPGLDWDRERDPEETLRYAGRQLAFDCAVRADHDAIEGWHSLFSACTKISSIHYERAAVNSRMVIAKRGHPAIRHRVMFAGDLKLTELRGARKLLELSSRGPALHSDSQSILGLAEVEGYRSEDENVFDIVFLGHNHWELKHANNVLMRAKCGLPYLPRPSTYETKLPEDLPRLFNGISQDEISLLVSLIRQAEQEPHGTLLVITSAAAQEAERLRAQATLIEPVSLTPELLRNLTPIDGAVILDPRGNCHAIGVILDGLASELGNPARGARYNSALRYVSSASAPCLAIIVSEDGGVDLLPDLRPRIRRSLIDQAMKELDRLVNAPKVSWRRYNSTLDWLLLHEFYLREEDRVSINRAMAAFDQKIKQEEPMRPRIVRDPLEVRSNVDEDFYYEPENA